jgi:hypothetical protein
VGAGFPVWIRRNFGVAAQWVMPIPAQPIGRSNTASTMLRMFEQLHSQVREEIRSLDDAGLNWSPGPGSNSIATIVIHVVGSEAETLRCLADTHGVRDRQGEFSRGQQTVTEVFDELRAADELITELQSEIGMHRLRTLMSLPTLPAEERRSGFAWLAGNYGHACEHVGHIQLTKQLYVGGLTAP